MLIDTVECCDNIVFMEKIQSNTIDCIYCDVLFGTGRKFNDYDDPSFRSFDDIKEFYENRFIQMRRVLQDTGLLYIHCDSQISHYIKVLLDQIFSARNFRNEIVWYYNSAPRKKKDFGKRHDVIFRYSKTDRYYFDDTSPYVRQPYSDTAPRGYDKEKYYSPLGKVKDDVWVIPMLGQNDKKERTGYSTQKPLDLMYPIIDSSCPKDGIVADFFCGSGTFLVAAKKLGRRYVGCDVNQNAVEITTERLTK